MTYLQLLYASARRFAVIPDPNTTDGLMFVHQDEDRVGGVEIGGCLSVRSR